MTCSKGSRDVTLLCKSNVFHEVFDVMDDMWGCTDCFLDTTDDTCWLSSVISMKPLLRYKGGLTLPFLIHSCLVLILVARSLQETEPSLHPSTHLTVRYALTLVVSLSLLYLLQGIWLIHHLSCLCSTRPTLCTHTHTFVCPFLWGPSIHCFHRLEPKHNPQHCLPNVSIILRTVQADSVMSASVSDSRLLSLSLLYY